MYLSLNENRWNKVTQRPRNYASALLNSLYFGINLKENILSSQEDGQKPWLREPLQGCSLGFWWSHLQHGCYEDKDPLYPVKGPILVHVLNSHYSHCAFEASFELSNETTFDQEKLLEASERGLSSMSKQQLFQGVNPRNKWMFVQWRDWKEGVNVQTEDLAQWRCGSTGQAKNSIPMLCPGS